MEKSGKNYSSVEKVLPALLIVVGLICASWVSTQTRDAAAPAANRSAIIVYDTAKKTKKNREATKAVTASKTPTQNNAVVDSQADITDKKIEEDSELMQGFPPMPPMDIAIPDFPPVPEMYVMMDDLHAPAFAWRNEDEWDEFAKEFERNFSEKFEAFYEQHGEDIHNLIEDVNEKVNSNFNEAWETKIQEFASRHEEWAKNHAEKWEQQAEKMAALHEQNAREHARRAEQHVKEFEKNHQRFEKQQRAFEQRNKLFEDALRDELIRDGYLEKTERLENMHWHNGKIEINGEKIKAEHEEKYNQFHQKYFSEIQPLEEGDDN